VSCRRPDGTSQENIRFVVGRVAVAARGAFDVLDAGVVGFHTSSGGAGDDEDFDLFPPPADGAVEPVRLGSGGCLDEDFEFLFRGGVIFQRAGAQQGPQLFLDLPHGLERAGEVVGGDDLRQPGGLPCR
jgi:hypothetical protein